MDKSRVVFDENGTAFEMVPLEKSEEPAKIKGKKPDPDRGFSQLWLDEIIARRNEVSTGAFFTFLALVRQMDRVDGIVFYDLVEVKELTGMSQKTYTSNLIAELVTAGWLRRVRRSVVAVNPHLAWRGKGDDRGVAKFRWDNSLPHRRTQR